MPESRSLDKPDFLIAFSIALGLFLYHVILSTLPGYGYFIDELYYIACSKRLAFGYIDHPPLSILLLALIRLVLGESLPAIRVVPAFALAATVFFTGLLTGRLGGTRWAIVTACLAMVAMPVGLVMGSFYSMNAFEIAIWAVILYLAIRLLGEENPTYWVAIGILLGLGLEMKHTMAVYGIALMAGMLLTPARRLLRNRWFAWGVVSCAVLLLPNLIWQAVHGFPSLEFYRNAMVSKNIPKGALGILADQVLFANPLALPLWIAGLAVLLLSKRTEKYRSLGWTYCILLLVMILSGSSRPDRIAAIYPVLFAAGAVALHRIQPQTLRCWLTAAVVVLLSAGVLIVAPVFTPLLPPPTTSSMIASLGVPLSIESGKTRDPLPQWLGDRLGWRELAVEVSRVYRALPAEEQHNAVIISTNYGEAGALELYGEELGLPPVFATHNSYHAWGPPPDSVRTYIGVFVNRRDLERRFESLQEAGVQTCAYCTRPQQRIPIYVARGPRFSVTADWPSFKIFN